MDDGFNHKDGFYFCTESFTFIENKRLVSLLKINFDLNASIHSVTNGHRLYILSKSKDRLVELVKPYLLPVFHYKLAASCTPVLCYQIGRKAENKK